MKRCTAAIVLTLGCAGLGAQTPETTDICGRTSEVQTKILEATPADDVCGNVLTSELQAITSLRFPFDPRLPDLRVGDFSGLTGLRTLTLIGPDGLPANVFSGLDNLQTLTLEAGVTADLHTGTFSGLTNLRTLEISNALPTDLRALPTNIFSGLTNLQTLIITTTGIEMLSADVFSDLTNLRTLELRDNYRLSMLPAGVFRGLTRLTRVELEKIPSLSNPTPLPFTFTVRPEIASLQSPGQPARFSVKLTLREGAPRPITADLSATGATLSADSLTIPTGGVESSDVVTMTRVSGSTSAVLTINELTLGGSDGNYNGFNVVGGEPVINICARTGKIRNAILAATADPDDRCGAVSPSSPTGLAGVTGLSVEFQFITSVRVDDFSGLTGLRRLSLALNRIRSTTLPGDIFSDLTNLRTLNLSHMSLETLPTNLLSGLIHLQTLDFAGNALTMLPVGVFSGLTSLLELDLRSNDLDALPDGVFSDLTRLRTLELQTNSLGVLPADVFSKLTRLRKLDLGGNDLTELSPDVFSGLTNLRTLILASNLLSTLPASVFSGLTELTELNLNNNPQNNPVPLTFSVRPRVEPLSPSTFSVRLTLREGAPREIQARLSATGATLSTDSLTIPTGRVESRDVVTMTRVPGGTPAVLTISGLTLGGPNDKYIGFTVVSTEAVTNVCARTDAVETAILAAIATADSCEGVPVSALAATAELDLAGVGIRSLRSGDFLMLTGLQTLDLGSNDLSALPNDVFSGLAGLRTLDLADNQLAGLPAGVFATLTALRTLDLRDNSLDTLPDDVFSRLTSLRTLNLAGNQLTELPAGAFAGLTRLTEVRLDGNPDLITLRVKTKFDPPQLPSDFRSSTMTLTLREGAPRPITVGVTATGATPTSFSLTIPTGGVESDTFVTITRGSGPFELTFGEVALGGDDNQYTGIQVVTGEPFEGLVVNICGRTQIIQTRILEATPADDVCSAVATSELHTITELRFGFQELLFVQVGDFSGLTGLQTLTANGAGLLPANIFSELRNLQTLNLGGGVSVELQSGSFSGLANLRTLDINAGLSNIRRQLPADIFSGLINLQTLDLSGNELETLPVGVFSELNNLRRLDLEDNYRLSMLPAGVFRGLTRLTRVELEKTPNSRNPMPLPLTFTVRPEIAPLQSSDQSIKFSVKLTLREGAPRPITAALSATGATLSADSLTIPTGHVESDATVTMTRLPGSTSAVLTISRLTLGGSNSNYNGFNVVIGEAVTDVCDRTALVQTGILSETRTPDDVCSAVRVSELAAITRLSFSSSGILALRRGDFSMLTGLNTLNLEDNQLTGLPTGLLAELTALQTLSLAGNMLNALPAGIFSESTGLLALNLANNQLTGLTAGIFAEQTDLQTLNLAGNMLNTLPAGIFSESTGLLALNLENNDLGALPDDVFLELTDLRTLNLADNQLTELPPGVFSELNNLQVLNLASNSVDELPADVFSGLTELTEVYLAGNSGAPFTLTVRPRVAPLQSSDQSIRFSVGLELREGAPRQIRAHLSAAGATPPLLSLTIPTGRVESDGMVTVTRVPGSTSAVLTVNTLTLGGSVSNYNGFNVVGGEAVTDVCDRTDAVETAILAAIATAGTCATVPTSELRTITELNLAGAGITSLRSDDFSMLTGLATLNLASNDLSALPGDVFSELTGLRTLNLADNRLAGLPAGVFATLTGLRTLDLGSNGLGTLPGGVFSRLTNLQTLDLADNRLAGLPAGVFTELIRLQALDMSSNLLSMLPTGVFTGLTNLNTLDLGDNSLGTLPGGVFAGLTGLTEVHLSGNPGSTFTLTVEAKFDPPRLRSNFRSAAVTLSLREGAPRPTTVGVTVTGATPTSFSLTIPTGGVESDTSVEITRSNGPFELTLGPVTLGGADADYSGFTVVPGPPAMTSSGVRLRLKMFLEGALE